MQEIATYFADFLIEIKFGCYKRKKSNNGK